MAYSEFQTSNLGKSLTIKAVTKVLNTTPEIHVGRKKKDIVFSCRFIKIPYGDKCIDCTLFISLSYNHLPSEDNDSPFVIIDGYDEEFVKETFTNQYVEYLENILEANHRAVLQSFQDTMSENTGTTMSISLSYDYDECFKLTFRNQYSERVHRIGKYCHTVFPNARAELTPLNIGEYLCVGVNSQQLPLNE